MEQAVLGRGWSCWLLSGRFGRLTNVFSSTCLGARNSSTKYNDIFIQLCQLVKISNLTKKKKIRLILVISDFGKGSVGKSLSFIGVCLT
jgi:hypothetical protein